MATRNDKSLASGTAVETIGDGDSAINFLSFLHIMRKASCGWWLGLRFHCDDRRCPCSLNISTWCLRLHVNPRLLMQFGQRCQASTSLNLFTVVLGHGNMFNMLHHVAIGDRFGRIDYTNYRIMFETFWYRFPPCVFQYGMGHQLWSSAWSSSSL